MKRGIVIAALGIAASFAGAAPAQALVAQPCGLFKPCFPGDSAPPMGEAYNGSTYELTLEADSTLPRAGQAVTFTGFVKQDGAPVSAGRFDLVASRFPYTSAEVVATSGPTTDSTYSFTHVPQLNTRYYVNTGDLDPGDGIFALVSSVLQVRVFARARSFNVAVPQTGLLKASVSSDFPAGTLQALGGRKMRWYISRGKRLTKIAVTRTSSRGSVRRVKAKVLAELPPGRYKFRATYCLSLGAGADVGIGDPSARCP